MKWITFIHTYPPTHLPTCLFTYRQLYQPGWLSVRQEIFLCTWEERKYLSWITCLLTFESCFVSGFFACYLLGVNWIKAINGCNEVILIWLQFHKNRKTSYCYLVLFIVCFVLIGRQLLQKVRHPWWLLTFLLGYLW